MDNFDKNTQMMETAAVDLRTSKVALKSSAVEEAVRGAFESPLLNDFDLKTARNVLVNITCSDGENGLTMDDLSEINKQIDEYTGRN